MLKLKENGFISKNAKCDHEKDIHKKKIMFSECLTLTAKVTLSSTTTIISNSDRTNTTA